jgi:hypothetical protein
MQNEVLRDRDGRRIGEIENSSNGTLILRDASGRRLGEYDPRQNVTRDVSGRRVGEGNLLTMLLK